MTALSILFLATTCIFFFIAYVNWKQSQSWLKTAVEACKNANVLVLHIEKQKLEKKEQDEKIKTLSAENEVLLLRNETLTDQNKALRKKLNEPEVSDDEKKLEVIY